LSVFILVHEVILVAQVVGIDVNVAQCSGDLLLWGSLELGEEVLKGG
jgi:hypothetical protein